MIGRFLKPPELDRWDDYFEPGEVLLWQGAPEPGIKSVPKLVFLSIFGVPCFFGGVMVATDALGHLARFDSIFGIGFGLFLLAFSLPFLTVGSGLMVGTWIFAANEHQMIRYALSNKRAYIARSIFKHALESHVIGPDDTVTLEQGKADNVQFKNYQTKDSDGDTQTKTIGFDGIKDG
ncbi:MAG: hypothetical protein AAGF56_07815, partial [Pseudomonadota bacterium]